MTNAEYEQVTRNTASGHLKRLQGCFGRDVSSRDRGDWQLLIHGFVFGMVESYSSALCDAVEEMLVATYVPE